MFTYRTRGTCSTAIEYDIQDNKLTYVRFIGGCSGNTQGISRLTKNMTVDEVIARLEGIRCGFKSTSCPDQLAQALRKYQAEHPGE